MATSILNLSHQPIQQQQQQQQHNNASNNNISNVHNDTTSINNDTNTDIKKPVPIDNYNTNNNNNISIIHKTLLEPELHIIGEIVGATGIRCHNLFCYYRVVSGNDWLCVGGNITGQTQVDYPYISPIQSVLSVFSNILLNNNFIFNHPLDIHYYTTSLTGWPKIIFELYTLDNESQHHIIGYGMTHIPYKQGTHNINVDMWRICGSDKEEFINLFTYNTPSLVSTELIYDAVKAKNDRPVLQTESVGKLNIRLDVMLRNLNNNIVTG